MNQSIIKILQEVLSKTEPSSEESKEAEKQSQKTLKKINNRIKNIKAKATIQGSFHKKTQLKNFFDIDVFVQFNYKQYSLKEKELSNILEKKLKKHFNNFERLHGSRDYFHIKEGKHVFEIIPILEIRSYEKAKNITDVSPLHARWVRKNSKKKTSEIKLTKAFLKAQGIYGADSYIKGFSGYACEILTIHYGSFLKLLKGARTWKEKQIIDYEKHYKRKDPLFYLNKSKTNSPLVLIDPVQPNRNATAALSKQSYEIFRKTAARFLTKPSINFFQGKKTDKQSIKRKKRKSNKLLIIDIKPEHNKPDVIGTSILKKHSFLKKQFEQNYFKIEKSHWFWNPDENPVLWFLITNQKPKEYELRQGPSPERKEHFKRFKEKHKKLIKKKGKTYAKTKTKFRTPEELVEFVTKQKNFKDKTIKITNTWH